MFLLLSVDMAATKCQRLVLHRFCCFVLLVDACRGQIKNGREYLVTSYSDPCYGCPCLFYVQIFEVLLLRIDLLADFKIGNTI